MPDETRVERIKITLQAASAQEMQTMSASNYLPRQRVNQAIGREGHRRARAAPMVVEKPPI